MVNSNFRKYVLSTGKEIIAGKSAEQNDLLVSVAKRNDFLLHTLAPGSPFVNIGESPTKQEIKEAAIFCALKSHDFRDNHSDVFVHLFMKNFCKKEKTAKNGTWNVSKITDSFKIKKSDILSLEKQLAESQ